MKAVSPDYALISAGVGNKHEHPTKSVRERIEKRKIDVYRTDESGTVTIIITANDIKFDVKPGDYADGIELAKRYEK